MMNKGYKNKMTLEEKIKSKTWVSLKQPICADAYLREKDALQICKEALEKQKRICANLILSNHNLINEMCYDHKGNFLGQYINVPDFKIAYLICNTPEPTWDE